jgi:hypothetical protein
MFKKIMSENTEVNMSEINIFEFYFISQANFMKETPCDQAGN